MVEPAAGKVKVGHTSKFSVLDAKGSKVKHVAIKAAAATAADVGDEGAQQHGQRDKTRLTESTGKLIGAGRGRIGGDFTQQASK
eukprot:jgi/Undpi1/5505/HiC_scaffold_2.g00784.m1